MEWRLPAESRVSSEGRQTLAVELPFRNTTPPAAIESRFGVWTMSWMGIGPWLVSSVRKLSMKPRSVHPRSSPMIRTTFGGLWASAEPGSSRTRQNVRPSAAADTARDLEARRNMDPDQAKYRGHCQDRIWADAVENVRLGKTAKSLGRRQRLS